VKVTPLPPQFLFLLIRNRRMAKRNSSQIADVSNNLVRLAHPMGILRNPVWHTHVINMDFLQSLLQQKEHFSLLLAIRKGYYSLLSKNSPPVFSDAIN